jgi:hypothetical protein
LRAAIDPSWSNNSIAELRRDRPTLVRRALAGGLLVPIALQAPALTLFQFFSARNARGAEKNPHQSHIDLVFEVHVEQVVCGDP